MVKTTVAGNPTLVAALANLLGATEAEMGEIKRVVIDLQHDRPAQVYVHRYQWDGDTLTSLIKELTFPDAAELHNVAPPAPKAD